MGARLTATTTALVVCLAMFAARPAQAAEAAPAGPILTIESRLAPIRQMTMAEIERLPRGGFATRTPWHDVKTRFEGVPLPAFLAAIGATRGVVTVSGLDGYVVDLPVEDPRNAQAVVAYKRDGEYMRIRDKGPLFIIYDYDADPALQTDQYYARSIWQIRSVKVE
ncbi:MAG: oxidoreductase [Rhizobiales bacterium]|nr:oxidoreductase [Hyphomicrobiales bacterium]